MKAPGIRREGTAKQLADHDRGYVASGEGQYSRRSAHAHDIKLQHTLVPRMEKRILQSQSKLQTETDPIRRARLEKDIRTKREIIERVSNE